MSVNLPPTVCLDGAAVRRIREEKRLTQLYVAKVVGVTTDTISRWENNRYPTIKRENALRLGEALEVPVLHILQGEDEGTLLPTTEVASFWKSTVFRAGAALLCLVAGAVVFFTVRERQPPVMAAPLAQRLLLDHGAPGNVIPVRVRIDAGDEAKGFILREHFPAGWKMIEASPPASSLDNEEGTARWIVKPGEKRTLIVYLLRADKNLALGEDGLFRGEVIASSENRIPPAPVGGDTRVTTAKFLWADQNSDSRIDDAEMLEASDIVDEMNGVHIDWKQLETIWGAGSYRWDEEKRQFQPVKAQH